MKYYVDIIGISGTTLSLNVRYKITVLDPNVQAALVWLDDDGNQQLTVDAARDFSIDFTARLGEWLELLKDDIAVWLNTFTDKTPYNTFARDVDLVVPAWSDPKFAASIQRTITLYSGDRQIPIVPLTNYGCVIQTDTLRVVDFRHSSFTTAQVRYRQYQVGTSYFSYILCAWLNANPSDVIGTSPTWVSDRMAVTTAGSITSAVFSLSQTITNADWVVFGLAVVRTATPSNAKDNAGQYAQVSLTLTR